MLAHVTCFRNALSLTGGCLECSPARTGHWVSGVSWGIGLQALKFTVTQLRGAVFDVVAIPEQGVPLGCGHHVVAVYP